VWYKKYMPISSRVKPFRIRRKCDIPVPSKESEPEESGRFTDLGNFTLVAGSSVYSAFPTA